MGGIAGIDKKAFFCFILDIEIANFKQEDRDNVTLISVFVYVLGMYSSYLYINIQRGNIVSSLTLARRLAMPDIK